MKPEASHFPIAREGWVFILPLAALTLLLWLLALPWIAAFFALLTIFTVAFFRDPERTIPPDEKAVVSPADGTVLHVTPCAENRFLKQPTQKISIFMSVFNVHVNRIPLTGRIAERRYFPGKFFRANLDKASELNEHNALVIETPGGTRILAVQIAGLIARRIVCHLAAGDEVTRGRRFGLIRFGSRMDVYLPENARIAVRPGQKVHGGETILGTLP